MRLSRCRRTLFTYLVAFLLLHSVMLLCLPYPLAAQGPLEIAVHGLTGEPEKNVNAALTLPSGLVKEGKLDSTWLEHFESDIPQKVRAALEPFGYFEPRIDISKRTTDTGFRIHVEVSPGEPVIISVLEVRVEGPGERETALKNLVDSFPMKNGDILRQDLYEEAKAKLRSRAVDLGYTKADFAEHSILISKGLRTAEVKLVLQTGLRYRFGDVTFSGTSLYPQGFLRRYVTFRKGDPFSSAEIAQTHFNLRNADRFKDVSITADQEAAASDLVPVDIRLEPSASKRLKTGFGYMTDTGLNFTNEYRDLNVARSGRELGFELSVSEKLQTLTSRYTIPGQKALDSFFALGLKLQHQDLSTYTSDIATADLEQTRKVGKGMLASFLVTAVKESSTAGEETTNSFSLYPGFRFSSRNFDDPVRPRKGYYCKAEVRGTHQLLGSDTAFGQLDLEGSVIIPLPARFSLLSRVRTAGTIQNDPNRDLPIPLRFFAGGDRSVRGYTYQSLGPKDTEGNVVGGKNLFAGTVQLERALGRDMGVVAFYDTGNAFNNFSQMELAQGVGIGGRYYTPVGPIELDVARQIGVADPGWRIHLTIGFHL